MSEAAHPYRGMPARAFWSQAVARGWNPRDLFTSAAPLLKPGDRIVSAGSCFAANIVPYLEQARYEYVRTEHLDAASDRFHYHLYSAGYGNLYTPRQLLQLIRRCKGEFSPIEDRWRDGDAVIDPFRPGLPYPSDSDAEFDLVTSSHLDRVQSAFTQASVFIFTLGLTEAWISRADGAVFPACPGTIAGTFDPHRHGFVNFDVAEIIDDVTASITALRTLNRDMRVILTVSPVPLVATATDNHVFVANACSKSVLRVACEQVSRKMPEVAYFPAFEIVTSDAPNHFMDDRRNVTQTGVKAVVDALLAHCELPAGANLPSPAGNAATDGKAASARDLSQIMVQRECEESMSDPGTKDGG